MIAEWGLYGAPLLAHTFAGWGSEGYGSCTTSHHNGKHGIYCTRSTVRRDLSDGTAFTAPMNYYLG